MDIKPPQEQLGFGALLSIALGQIIGIGVVVLTGIAIGMTGFGTPWAFLLALGIVAIPTMCIAALGSAIPSTGGNYTYVRDLIGPKTSFIYLALLLAAQIFLASMALSFAQYLGALVPGIPAKPIAVLVLVGCYVANLFGIETAARLQTFLVVGLIVALILYIGFGMGRVHSFEPYFDPAQIFPKGFSGFFAAAFLLRLSLVGSEFVAEFGGEMKDPGRTIPLVMASSLAIIIFLYIGVAIVASGVLPLEQVAGENLAGVAKEIFTPALYVVFIIGGVLISLVTSLNAIFAWCTRGLFMATQDGWLPIKAAAQNRFGTYYIFLSVFFLVGLTPVLTGMSIDQVSVLGNAFGAIFGIMPVLALMNLAKRKPEAYAGAPFRLPKLAMTILPIIALMIYGYGIYFSWDFIGVKSAVIFAIYAACALAYAVWREPVVTAKRIKP
ncbi:MAG TPA: amino acid permease [Hellea balneolensis]|uniref:Amino acid permease n=1 Tax=Hellea balneolensis TaxID=287478 RepID=A0A7C3GK83_9PROT|nr:amino acid permease [Hellea balneolensis]